MSKHVKYENITSKWGNMEVRREFAKKIDDWLAQFTDEEQKVLLELLKSFFYYSDGLMQKNAKRLFELLIKHIGAEDNSMIYCSVFSEYGVSNSDLFFTMFWQSNGLKKRSINDCKIFSSLEEIPQRIAIVDDFSGSGEKIITTIKYITEMNEQLKSADYYCLLQHITETARENIAHYSNDYGINLVIISIDDSEKAFNADYVFQESDVELARSLYSEICCRKRIKSPIMGRNSIEALVALEHSTPNDTLKLFWSNTEVYNSLFRDRNDDFARGLNRIKTCKKSRDDSQKIVKLKDSHVDSRLAVYVNYCLSHGKTYNLNEISRVMGLNPKQVSELVCQAEDEGLLTWDGEQYLPTKELNSFLRYISMDKENETPIFETGSYIPQKF